MGVVKDEAGSLLENCRVTLSPGGHSVLTDASGAFSVEKLEAGNYTVTFSKTGYSDQSQDVKVVADQITTLSVIMKEPPVTTGQIMGVVKDFDSPDVPLQDCMVTLNPGGKSVVTTSDGFYEFTQLSPREYSLTITKGGYNNAQKTVSVTAGITTTADVMLKAKAAFAMTESFYDFGEIEVAKTFYISNYSSENCSYKILNKPVWMYFDNESGIVPAGGTIPVTAYVDREQVGEGSYQHSVTISYSGKESGAVTLSLSMKKVVLTAPEVRIEPYASNVKQNSFDISGAITATGGSQVLSYGHCWNLTGNPTVNDAKTDLGTTDALIPFTSTATGLSVYTTYYVRAYARNSQGITYSDEVTVTTQDVGTDKWDGTLATSFSGGSGSSYDPYIITTGGQLLLARNYSDKYFALGGNIDLNNKNWLPFEFEGTLDGKGYTISNLYINRTDAYQGLFSKCSGTVSNLTVKNVNINAPQCSYVGVISGSGGTFTNCKVIFGTTSSVTGNNYVGGISGYGAKITNCHVESSSASPVVRGNRSVGGVIGCAEDNIEWCTVNARIAAAYYVGGVVGEASQILEINDCSFVGSVVGETRVGGILGFLSKFWRGALISRCKASAEITATSGNAGGIVGEVYEISLNSCYTCGSLSAIGHCGGLAGYSGDSVSSEINANMCYSTIQSTSELFVGLGKGVYGVNCASTNAKAIHYSGSTNVVAKCTDITTFLKECYSEYAGYWNFNNTWTWTGVVDGKTVSVSCPKLAWEK